MTDEILTSEAVALEVRPASFFVRVLVFAIDATAIVGFASMVGLIATLLGFETMEPATRSALSIGFLAFCAVGMPTVWETLSQGRSPGKLALGYRIFRDDGAPIRFREALTRSVVGLFENVILGGAPALVVAAVNARGKRIGDILAGTYPVRVRGVRWKGVTMLVPPELAPWVAHVDIGPIPDGLALAARRFIDRAAQLTPESRFRQGVDLAARVERYVAPPPPLHTPAEHYLAAVLAVVGARENAAYAARRSKTHRLMAPVGRLGYGLADPPS
jgi:uncharacterized RDD family membrane protein YckC